MSEQKWPRSQMQKYQKQNKNWKGGKFQRNSMSFTHKWVTLSIDSITGNDFQRDFSVVTSSCINARVTSRDASGDHARTVGWNDLKSKHSIHRLKLLSYASERANEWAQRSARALRRKQMSERCERTKERMAQYSTRRFHGHSTQCGAIRWIFA